MMKRSFVILLIGLFLLPSVVSAVSPDPRMAIRSDAAIMMKLDLKGKLKDLFVRGIEQAKTEPHDETGISALMEKLVKTGYPMFAWLAGNDPDPEKSFYASLAATEEDFEVLKKEGVPRDDGSNEVAFPSEGATSPANKVNAYFQDGRLYVTSPSNMGSLRDLISGFSGTSILGAPVYTELLKYAIPDSDIEVFLDGSLFQKIFGGMGVRLGLAATPTFYTVPEGFQNLDDFLRGILLSLKETAAGYKFSGAITSSVDFLKKYNVSLMPGGMFTPSLYKRLPSGKLIYYEEANDVQENFENEKRLMSAILGEDVGGLEGVTLNSYIEAVKAELDLDITPLVNALKGQVAFAIQDDASTIYPVFTMLADVSADPSGSAKTLSDLVDAFVKAMKEEGSEVSIKVEEAEISNGKFKKLTIKPDEFDEDFRDMDPEPVVIFAGVTGDGTMVITNHPKIKETYGAGAPLSNIPEGPIGSIATINIRNLIQYINRGIKWWITAAAPANRMLEFDDLQTYFTFIQSVYPAREFTAFTRSEGESSASFEGLLAIDKVAPPSYETFLDTLKKSDTDEDGLFDYDEIYKYHLNPRAADSDGDGKHDQQELNEGTDPYGVAGSLTDVEEGQWYVKEVGPLYRQGIIKGYEDKTLKPHRRITRAEFTCMVTRAFQDGDFEKLIQPGSAASPLVYSGWEQFQDMTEKDWFYSCVMAARGRDYVQGEAKVTNDNPYVYTYRFRPNDPITRAEAAAILERVMLKNLPSQDPYGNAPATDMHKDKNVPFTDVKESDWFYANVRFGYSFGIIKGRSADTFDPHGFLTRVEAAAMIQRLMEARFQLLESVQPEKLPLENVVPILNKLF